MSRQLLDMSDLPEEARESLRDYFEFLRRRYAESDRDEDAFDPTTYRGAVDLDSEAAMRRLDELREEWERHE